MKLIWTKTGDQLDIDVSHPELAEHWFEQLPSHSFKIKNDRFPYDAIQRLRTVLIEINELLISKFRIRIFDYGEFKLDQNFLNKVHRDWATVQQQNPNLTKVLDSMGDKHLEKFYDINDVFHDIETGCKIEYVEQSSDTLFKYQMPGIKNPERFLVHGRSQLELQYWSIGRDDYDAWSHGDDVAFIDNFTQLPFAFEVYLNKPFVAPFPETYVKWMQDRNRTPVGSHMQLGNFKGYTDSVADLYEIFIKNNKVDQKIKITL